jgi:hypothetical protein
MHRAVPVLIGGLLLVGAAGVPAQTLKGSRVAMQRQHQMAREQDYTFLRTPTQVRKFVSAGLLVPVPGNRDYQLDGVSFPYARPALRTFVLRLAQQHRSACGEKLVITSLTRPLSEQPSNASDLSVHPTGMAVDLRVSRKASCERWLTRTLLALEKQGVLDVTRERRPPHFHVAVFPERYLRYVDRLGGEAPVRLASASGSPTARLAAQAEESTSLTGTEQYEVNRGDSLWDIARRYKTTVTQLKELNGLSSSRIAAGQVISIPAEGSQP